MSRDPAYATHMTAMRITHAEVTISVRGRNRALPRRRRRLETTIINHSSTDAYSSDILASTGEGDDDATTRTTPAGASLPLTSRASLGAYPG